MFEPSGGDSLMFVGTATTVLRLGPFTLLTDPNFLHRGQWSYFGQGLFSRRRTEPALQPAELPPLTAVVLSHLHGDHFDRIASRELPRDVPIVTTEHAATRLLRRGFHAPLPLSTWMSESFTDGDARVTITSVPARHAPGLMQRVLPPVMGTVLEYRARAVPVHFDDYGLFHSPVSNFLEEIRVRKPATRVHLLQRGEYLPL